MFKHGVKLFLFVIILFFSNIYGQGEESIEFNVGVLYPRSSSNGFATSLKYNLSLNKTFSLYLYTGYSYWDKFKVVYIAEITAVQKKQILPSYSSDNHILIPIYFGTNFNLHTNKLFTSFLEFELGYSYFSYNSYENYAVKNEITGEIISYKADIESKKEVNDNLFGIGIGGGLSHPLSQTLNIILGYRLNSNFNSGDFGLFSAKGTYSTLYLGLNLKL